MSSLTRAQREQVIRDGRGYLILDQERLLYPIIDQDDLDQLSSRLAASRRPASYVDELKKKAVLVAKQLNLRLPSWAANLAQAAPATTGTASSASFSGGQGGQAAGGGSTEEGEALPDAVESATSYAKLRNKGLPAGTRGVPQEHVDARQQAEEYAERRNRQMKRD